MKHSIGSIVAYLVSLALISCSILWIGFIPGTNLILSSIILIIGVLFWFLGKAEEGNYTLFFHAKPEIKDLVMETINQIFTEISQANAENEEEEPIQENKHSLNKRIIG